MKIKYISEAYFKDVTLKNKNLQRKMLCKKFQI